jgi:hypothetical protein
LVSGFSVQIPHTIPIDILMTVISLQTKQCPYCAETIQAQAIKCRFCGEFLNGDQARTMKSRSESDSQLFNDTRSSDEVLFRARPSLCARAGSLMRWLVLLAGAGLLAYFPIERMANDLLNLKLAESHISIFSQYRVIVGAGLAGIALFFLLIKIIRLKAVCYEITADRIEWRRGVLSRRYDNLDMFRVVDLKLHRNLFDCILGVGTVTLVTTDKTDPEFLFEKMRKPRKLYDVIKKSSLKAAKQSSVLHLEKD